MVLQTLIIRDLDQVDYVSTWHRMRDITIARDNTRMDELWLLEHPPVFTLGQAGKPEHVLAAGDIPVIPIDRGGQVTYHGPGQLVAYPLIDIRRKNISVHHFVRTLEQITIALLKEYGINANTRENAPGVYVEQEKICSIGLRIKRGCSYHGIALNVAMDLSPFQRINPCGYAGLQMTQIKAWQPHVQMQEVKQRFIQHFMSAFAYDAKEIE